MIAILFQPQYVKYSLGTFRSHVCIIDQNIFIGQWQSFQLSYERHIFFWQNISGEVVACLAALSSLSLPWFTAIDSIQISTSERNDWFYGCQIPEINLML